MPGKNGGVLSGEPLACKVCGETFIVGRSRSHVCPKCARSKWGKDARERKKAYLWSYKAEKGCAICGESDPVVLQPHHIDPDSKHRPTKKEEKPLYRQGSGVSYIVNGSYGVDTLKKELEKCVILCANCHLRVHAGTVSLDDQ